MRIISFLILAVLTLAACQKNEKSLAWDALEQQFSDNPSLSLGDSLLTHYTEELESLKPDADAAPVLFKAGRTADQISRIPEAISYYQRILRESESEEYRIRASAELIDIFENKLKKEFATRCLKTGFVRQFPDHQLSATYRQSGTHPGGIDSLLAEKARSMFSNETQTLDRMAAIDYVDGCEIYALQYPDSDRTPDYLHKAAETARTLRTYDKAISFYDWIYNEFPDHPKAPQALFLKAFTLDDNLNRLEQAQVLYQEFIEKYPDNEFADDAQFLLDNLGKSDEEILESLMKK